MGWVTVYRLGLWLRRRGPQVGFALLDAGNWLCRTADRMDDRRRTRPREPRRVDA